MLCRLVKNHQPPLVTLRAQQMPQESRKPFFAGCGIDVMAGLTCRRRMLLHY
jgi:hypothetical protein